MSILIYLGQRWTGVLPARPDTAHVLHWALLATSCLSNGSPRQGGVPNVRHLAVGVSRVDSGASSAARFSPPRPGPSRSR
eukprot:3296049-Prymnesium_polylepis.1